MVKAILIDAMSTIFRFKNGLTKYEILRELLINFLGKELPVEKVKETYDRERAAFDRRPGMDYLLKWTIANRNILLALFPKMKSSEAKKVGRRIAKAMASDPALYQVNQDTVAFLKRAKKEGIKVIIASNQNSECLNVLIKHFELEGLTDQVYASEAVGLEKPDTRFFQKILEKEDLPPEECVMIGDNPKNDVEGPQAAGIRGVLLDPQNLHPEFEGHRIAQLEDFWLLKGLRFN